MQLMFVTSKYRIVKETIPHMYFMFAITTYTIVLEPFHSAAIAAFASRKTCAEKFNKPLKLRNN